MSKPVLTRRVRIKTAAYNLVDAGVSSLSNVSVSIAVAGSSSSSEFGFFSLMFGVYLVSLGVARSIASDPLMTRRLSFGSGDEAKRADRAATTTAFAVGLMAALVLSATAPVAGSHSSYVIVMALGLPGLLLQDVLRYVSFSNMRPGRALLLDSVWLIVMVLVLALLFAIDWASGETAMGAWLAGAWFAALLGVAKSSGLSSGREVAKWMRENRRLIGPYVGETAVSSGVTQIAASALALAGLTALGAWRGALTLVGPLTTAILGTSTFALPSMVRIVGRQDSRSLAISACLTSGSLLCVAGGWLVVLRMIPAEVGVRILGETWIPATEYFLPAAMWMAGAAAATGPQLALRAMLYAKTGLFLRILSGVATVGIVVPFAAAGRPDVAVWGFATASFVYALGNWVSFLLGTRRTVRLTHRMTGAF